MTKRAATTKSSNAKAVDGDRPPLWSRLPREQYRSADGGYKLGVLALHFMNEGRLEVQDAEAICDQATGILADEPNVLNLTSPLTVVGSLNGQLYDLMKIIKMAGSFEQEKYVFLGDYIGGGGFSLESFLFLLAAKVTFPGQVHLLRGSHESRFMFELYALDEHCGHAYSQTLQQKLYIAFNSLPLAATVDEKYMCVHGGLSPDISRIDDISDIHRFRDVPTQGAMCDLLWADPYWDVENPAVSVLQSSGARPDYYLPSAAPFDTRPTFQNNEGRGCSYLFNFACVRHFCSVNKLLCVIRSHEPQDEGFKLYRANPNNNFPAMISVFSAPNYCDTFGNKGAVLRIADGNLTVQQLFASPHPLVMHNLNGITWSLPFVMDCTRSFLYNVLSLARSTHDSGEAPVKSPENGSA